VNCAMVPIQALLIAGGKGNVTRTRKNHNMETGPCIEGRKATRFHASDKNTYRERGEDPFIYFKELPFRPFSERTHVVWHGGQRDRKFNPFFQRISQCYGVETRLG